MQVQVQQPGVSGVDQSLPVTKHTQSFSNADSTGKVLREVAVDYVQRKAGAGRNPIITHICRKSTHGSVVDWSWKWSGLDVFMGHLVIQKTRKHKHSLSLISENELKTALADQTNPLRLQFDNRHIDRSDRFRILHSKSTRYLQSFIPTAIQSQSTSRQINTTCNG